MYRICGNGKPGKSKKGTNTFMNFLRDYNLIRNKHIPLVYKCNSRENRLKLLAGFLDADGHLEDGSCFEVSQCNKHELLLDDIMFLSRSLGFSTYKKSRTTSWTHKGVKKFGTALRTHISGNGLHEIPTLCPRKKVLKLGIKMYLYLKSNLKK